MGRLYASRLMLNLLTYSVEVERILYLGVMVKLSVILLVKLNSAEEYLQPHLRFAPEGW
jgi:hypothetical protein